MDESDDLDIQLADTTSAGDVGEADREPIVVADDDVDDRYSRLRLIPWWDQDRLLSARVMVVGAGALGNEILKNLALLGIGHIFIVDMDNIENSNLSRSVLYRESDEGRSKAEVAAARIKEINPSIKVQWFHGNVAYDLGLGVFRSMDVVMAGLDNREARLAINQSCWKVNRPYIDGAIEVLHGFARVFVPPDGPCYECTMNELDYKLLSARRSCALLSRDELLEGKVPTTPTTSSIIAAVQVQEMVKLIHNRPELPVLKGKGFVFNGLTHDSYIVDYPVKEDCYSHDTYASIENLGRSVRDTTVGSMLNVARERLGLDAQLEFDKEIVSSLRCDACGTGERTFRALGRVTETMGRCPSCGAMRNPELTHAVYGNEDYLDMTLADIGLPPFDIVTARVGLDALHFELSGDREEALGELA